MRKNIIFIVSIVVLLTGCTNLYYNKETFTSDYDFPDFSTPEKPGAQLQVVMPTAPQSSDTEKSDLPVNPLYDNLTEKEKSLIIDIYTAWITRKEISFKNDYSYKEIEKMANLLYEQEPYMTNFTNGYVYTNSSVKFNYKYTESQMQKYISETENIVKSIVSKSPSGDYEKIKYFHDYLVQNCTYLSGEFSASPYGSLVRKTAICQGYAHAFMLLCREAGIECVCVTGNADGPHMWNKVKINNDWYVIDVTWDDNDFSDFPEFISYDYFLTTDSDVSTRTIKTQSLPVTTGQKDNFYRRNGYYITNVVEAYDITIKAYRDAINSQQTQATIKFSNRDLYNTIKKNYTEQNGLYNIQTDLVNQGYNINNRQMLYLNNDETLTLTFFIFFK